MTTAIATLIALVVIQAVVVLVLLVGRLRRAGVEQQLHALEDRWRLLADHAPVMIWTARPDTTLDYVNATCVSFTGRPLEQLLDEGWLDLVHPDDLDQCTGTYTPAVAARRPFDMEYRLRRHDGAYRWVFDAGVPKYANQVFAGYVGCTVDINARKEAEERIRESRAALEHSHQEIQGLAGRLIEAQDAERARVARDLHDDVSQQLAGMSIAFSGLRHRLDESQVPAWLPEDLRALHQRTTALAQSVRHLSHDLHPTVLRHAGLVSALTSHCAELHRAHAVRMSCSAEGDVASVAPHAALCLYRVAQEVLRNVIAHAGARRADVMLRRSGDLVEIVIADDGRGFDADALLERGRGLGLVSIRERVRLAGGCVEIDSRPGHGTRISARLPAGVPPQAAASDGIVRDTLETAAL